MVLKSLFIQNFRLHKKLKIKFGPNVTTIVGKSYAGKSTIVRALKWVCLNRPAGTSVIRWGEKQAKAVLRVDGKKVTRIRGKGKNQYLLGKEKFEAFGNDPPSKVSSIINIGENNFQGQHSLPFWFGETAGEVSRKLNKIVNLNVIDTTLQKLNSMRQKAKTVTQVTEERLKEARKKKNDLKYILEMQKEWKEITKLQKRLEEQEEDIEELEEITEKCVSQIRILKRIKPPSTKRAALAYKKLEKIEGEYTELEIVIDRIESAFRKNTRIQKEAERLEQERKKIMGDRCPLCKRKIT